MVYRWAFRPYGRNESSVPWIGKLWFSKVYIISIIHGAHWKSHECPTRDLSISVLGRYLCDENRMAFTKVWSLYSFLTLVNKSRPSTSFIYQHMCALYEAPGCTYRLIRVVEGLVCLNKCSVLLQPSSKNFQSLRHNRKFIQNYGMPEHRMKFNA